MDQMRRNAPGLQKSVLLENLLAKMPHYHHHHRGGFNMVLALKMKRMNYASVHNGFAMGKMTVQMVQMKGTCNDGKITGMYRLAVICTYY